MSNFGVGAISTIDADAVAEMGVVEDVGAVGDGQRGPAAAAGGVILFLEGGDSWLGQLSWGVLVELVSWGVCLLPTVSTIPVNMAPESIAIRL